MIAQGPDFSSHKFAMKSGLRYELALNIKTGESVWLNGGFPCGANPDLEIFRSSLMTYLEEFERVEADDGYIGEAPLKVRCPKCITTPLERKEMMAVVRMRHETVNRRIKQWRCMKDVFRHGIDFHSTCFSAVAVMTQIAISQGEPLFQVKYTDNIGVSDDEEEEWSGGKEDGSNSEAEEDGSDSDAEDYSEAEEKVGYSEAEEEVGESEEEDSEEKYY